MPVISTVLSTDSFLQWRNKTNDLIGLFNMPLAGPVTNLTTRIETFDLTESAGVSIGATVSDNGDGTVNVAAGEGLIRTAPDVAAQLVSVGFGAATNLALVDQSTNYIYVSYSGGTPVVASTTNKSIVNGLDVAAIAIVQRTGTNLTILQQAGESGDFERRITHRLMAAEGFSRAAGGNVTEPTPGRIAISGGEWYYGVGEYFTPSQSTEITAQGTATTGSTTSLQDTTKDFVALGVSAGDVIWDTTNNQHATITSITGTDALNFAPAFAIAVNGATTYEVTKDSFEYYYNNGAWVEHAGAAWDNTNFNTFGTGLTAMTAGFFKTDWIYLKIGSNQTTIYTIYGDAEYATQGEAATATPPQSLPSALVDLGTLIGRVIVQEGNPSAVSLDSVLNTQNFAASGATQFSDLSFKIFDDVDVTKKVSFDVANVTTGTERVLSIPNKHGTIATTDDVHQPHDDMPTNSSMGALSARVVPYAMTVDFATFENDTTISLNGTTIFSELPGSYSNSFAAQGGDIISSNRPISAKDKIDGNVLGALCATGEHFYFMSNRSAPHEVFIFAPEHDVTVIYKRNSTDFTTSDTVWDGDSLSPTSTIVVKKGTVKKIYVEYDAVASVVGQIPVAVGGMQPTAHHYIHTNGPVIVTREGAGGSDHYTVYPMSREILFPSRDGTGAQSAKSFTGSAVHHVGNGYYTADDIFNVVSHADGAGSTGHTGIPYAMCGDTYVIDHDIAGYQLLAIDATDIRVFVNDLPYAEIDATAASRTNPLHFKVGNPFQGTNAAASLNPNVGYVEYDADTFVGAWVAGQSVTQAVTGATATIDEVEETRIHLTNITGTFNTTDNITAAGISTCVLTRLPYRVWSFYATAPFALRTNDLNDDEYITLGYRKSLRTNSFDQIGQLNQTLHTLTDEIQERAAFVSNFDPDLDYEWTQYSGKGTHTNINSDTIVGGAGGKSVREVHGTQWMYYKEKIPYRKDALYKIAMRVRQRTVVGVSAFFLGVDGYKADGTTLVNSSGINSHGSQHYVGASSVTLPVGQWTVVEGYFSGHGAYIVGQATSPTNPSGLHADVRYFKPMFVANWPYGSGIVDIDWMTIEVVDDAAQIKTIEDKLTTIETGATADQTPQEILTAIKTVDGAGSGLDADLFDGRSSGAFALHANQTNALTTASDLNSVVTPNWYRWTNANPTNNPLGANTYGLLLVEHDGAQPIQIVFETANSTRGRIFTRRRDSSVWQAWKKVADAASLASLESSEHTHANSATLAATTASFTTALLSKLNAIEAGATADQTGPQIAALLGNLITSAHIAAGAVGSSEIATNAVTAVELANNAVDTAAVVDGAIIASKIAAGNVTNAKIGTNAVTTAKIGNLQVTGAKIAAGTITGNKLANGTITSTQLGDLSTTTAKLADGSVTTAKLATNAVTAVKIGASAVTNGKIFDGAVTAAKIATNAVTAIKIANGNVTNAKLGTNAVTAIKIATDAVTTTKIANGAVTGVKIATGVIDGTHMATGATVPNSVSWLGRVYSTRTIWNNANGTGSLVAGHMSWRNYGNGHIITDASSGSIEGNAVNKTDSGVAWSANFPTLVGWNGAQTYGVRVDRARVADTVLTIGANQVTTSEILNGSVTAVKLATNSVTTTKLGYQQVTGVKIAPSTITGDKLAVGTITGDKIADATIAVSKIIDGATSGLHAQWLGGHISTDFSLRDDTTSHVVSSAVANVSYANAALKIRETGRVSAGQTTAEYAPRMTFLWNTRFATQIGMDTVNQIRTYNQTGTGYADFRCADAIVSSINGSPLSTTHVGTSVESVALRTATGHLEGTELKTGAVVNDSNVQVPTDLVYTSGDGFLRRRSIDVVKSDMGLATVGDDAFIIATVWNPAVVSVWDVVTANVTRDLTGNASSYWSAAASGEYVCNTPGRYLVIFNAGLYSSALSFHLWLRFASTEDYWHSGISSVGGAPASTWETRDRALTTGAVSTNGTGYSHSALHAVVDVPGYSSTTNGWDRSGAKVRIEGLTQNQVADKTTLQPNWTHIRFIRLN